MDRDAKASSSGTTWETGAGRLSLTCVIRIGIAVEGLASELS
jgi:hypothetical protein